MKRLDLVLTCSDATIIWEQSDARDADSGENVGADILRCDENQTALEGAGCGDRVVRLRLLDRPIRYDRDLDEIATHQETFVVNRLVVAQLGVAS